MKRGVSGARVGVSPTPTAALLGSPPSRDASGIMPPSLTTPTSTPSTSTAPPAAPTSRWWYRLQRRKDAVGEALRLAVRVPPRPLTRTLYLNQSDLNDNPDWLDNRVTTSRYTWYNFIPVFLFQQFTRLANFFFLIVCVLQSIRSISITNGVPSSAFPLAFVLFFDGIVTAREDFNRHRDDARANARKVECLRQSKFVWVQWLDLKVGDIVKVRRNAEFPADLLFLAAGKGRDGVSGDDEDPVDEEVQRVACHVQTAQLDGETNLKLRRAPEKSVDCFTSDAAVAAFKGHVECEQPSEHFGRFTGTMYLPSGAAVPLDANATLLRGCVLKNVDFVYGAVLYTGNETKVRVKQQVVSGKKAAVESEINRYVLALLLIQLLMCAAGAIGNAVWGRANAVNAYYLLADAPTASEVIQSFFTFFLLVSSIIPISLYVSMKLTRVTQKIFMDRDEECKYVDTEALKGKPDATLESVTFPLTVRSMDLNDELGQISHVFSDKTGTLTGNYMEFKKLSVNGIAYGRGTTEIGLARRRRLGEDVTELTKLMAEAAASPGTRVPHVSYIDGTETSTAATHGMRYLLGAESDLFGAGAKRHPHQAEALHMFMLQMALNHTVVIETVYDKSGAAVGEALSASSPDEEAFVLAAGMFGYKYMRAERGVYTLQINGETARYRRVEELPYSQMRKMMSVIFEDLQAKEPNKRYMLLAKGADTKIFSKLAIRAHSAEVTATMTAEQIDTSARIVKACDSHLAEWAEDGLRTLCFAYRYLDTDFVEKWGQEYSDLLANIEEKRKKDDKKPNLIDDKMDEMEDYLVLQGATANEDKLQEEVPETISLLVQAGIKVYMLTGDKQDTAVNIGFAARMLTNEYEQLVYTSEEFIPAKGLSIRDIPDKLHTLAEEIRRMAATGQDFSKPHALVVDEPVMDLLLSGRIEKAQIVDPVVTRSDLLTVAEACKTVICCRCRPDQKKQMVHLIRTNVASARCLAVGDGANDVDMIQEANVGVGIAGAEGVQAANAADYAIGRFKYLRRLLLVHGRWNYNRMAMLVVYMFYKNLFYVFTQFLYITISAWSGQKFYVEAANQTFNLVYSGLPILIVAVLDRDVSAASAQSFPFLYSDGLFRRRLNLWVMLWWLGSSIYEAVLLFVFTVLASNYLSPGGITPYVFEMGSYVFTAVIVIITLRLAMNTASHTALFSLVLFASCALWWAAAYIFDVFDFDNMLGGMTRLFGNGGFWLWLLLVVVATQLHVFIITAVRHYFMPEYRNLVHEYEVLITPHGPTPGSQSWLQQLCGCGLRRPAARTRLTPSQKLALLERVRTPPGVASAASSAPASNVSTAADGNGQVVIDINQPSLSTPSSGAHERVRASSSAPAPATMDEVFGEPRTSGVPEALRCRPRPDAWTLPLQEDERDELVEYPYEQRLLYSMRMMTLAGVPRAQIDLARRNTLRARCVFLVENGLADVDPAPNAPEEEILSPSNDLTAAALEDGQVSAMSALPPSSSQAGDAYGRPVAARAARAGPEPTRIMPMTASAATEDKAGFGGASPGGSGIRASNSLPGEELRGLEGGVRSPGVADSLVTSSARPGQPDSDPRRVRALARLQAVNAMSAHNRRSSTDFSIDVGHAEFFGGALSDAGRARRSSTVAGGTGASARHAYTRSQAVLPSEVTHLSSGSEAAVSASARGPNPGVTVHARTHSALAVLAGSVPAHHSVARAAALDAVPEDVEALSPLSDRSGAPAKV